LNILYVFSMNPEDPSVQSGRPYSILQQMRARGHKVEVMVFEQKFWTRPYVQKARAALSGKWYGSDVSLLEAKAYAAAISRRVAASPLRVDMIFSPSIRPFACLETDALKVGCNDTLHADLIETYPEFLNAHPAYVRDAERREAQALANLDLMILPSRGAIRMATDRYGMPASKLHFAQFGGNLGWTPDATEVEAAIQLRAALEGVRFLFVGRSWHRKNGALVAATIAALLRQGVIAGADFVGIDAPPELPAEMAQFCTFHGRIPLTTADGARRLFEISRNTNFFFLPSRAEAYGMSFVEAASLGLPLIGTATGGIRDILGPNMGFQVEPNADPEAVASQVLDIHLDHTSYLRMAHGAFEAARTRLNWPSFWDSCEARIADLRQ
jgi:hypothetical protein